MSKISQYYAGLINLSTNFLIALIIIGGIPVIIFFVLLMRLTGKSYFISCLFKTSDYLDTTSQDSKESERRQDVDWKKYLKLGLQIKFNWTNISKLKKNFIPNFHEDCQQSCEEIYNSLKGKKFIFKNNFFHCITFSNSLIFHENNR